MNGFQVRGSVLVATSVLDALTYNVYSQAIALIGDVFLDSTTSFIGFTCSKPTPQQ